ncbi:dienelactone hydrolase family protein [Marinoscillum sp.]|uniref:dienelactone hydrolase family protein n=1 Tax=Marinoscillum sp. TaxID=2024838 RepID=UPI003BACC55E
MKIKVTTLPVLAVILMFWNLSISDHPTTARLDADMTACHTTTQRFASLANDVGFLNVHLDPLPNTDQDFTGKMITYQVPGGEDANAYFVASKKPSKEYLLVIHEWYGLNSYVKTESDKFASKFENMNVIALDLYDGKVADNSEDARTYMQSVPTERAQAIINAATTYTGKDAKIYTVGWCFGGGWSLQAAIEIGPQAKAAIMFYGMPETDIERLRGLSCDVLGIFAKQDQWITPEVAAAFKENMSKTDNELILKSYDAGHGFANPSNPVYNEPAATDAYKHMYDFITARR